MKSKATASNYTQFLETLQPISIAVSSCIFKVDRKAFFSAAQDTVTAKLKSIRINVGADEDEGVEYFDVACDVQLSIVDERNGSETVTFLATYEAHFHANHITDASVESFIQKDIRLIIWPYFRELVHSTSGRMNIPPIILPVASSSEVKGRRVAPPVKTALRVPDVKTKRKRA